MSNQERTERVLEAKRLLETSGISRRAAARQVGLPESTLRSRLSSDHLQQPFENDPEPPGVREYGDGSATVTSDVNASSWTPTEILEAHGMDPEAWTIISARANRWGDPETPMEQLRVNVIRNESILREADVHDWTPPPAPTAPEDGDRSVVICGDHHAPHHDKGLHKAFCGMLTERQPDLGILLGDSGDFATVSRHRKTPGFAQSVNEVNDGVVNIFRDYRYSSPRTRWILLRGNHDDRLEYALIDHNPDLYGVRPGTLDLEGEEPSLSLRRLWHLDELGIELVDTEWNRGKYPVTDALTARHGYMVSENTGKQMLAKHSNSQVQGHSHRMRFTYRTKHDPMDVRVAIEAGTMAEIKDGLGYDDEPNWQQGCLTGYAWEDGDFALAPCPYIKGRLLTPDGKRYRGD